MIAPRRRSLVTVAALAAAFYFPSRADGQSAQWTPTRTSPSAAARQRLDSGAHSSAVRATYDGGSTSTVVDQSQAYAPRVASTAGQGPMYPSRASVFVDRNVGRTGATGYSQNSRYGAGGSYASQAYSAGASSRGTYSQTYSQPTRNSSGPVASGVGVLQEFGIRLAQGERLVSPPTVSEGGPVGGTTNSPMPSTGTIETVPTPDGVSSGGVLPGDSSRRQDGPVVREGAPFEHDGTIHEGEVYHEGEFGPEGPHFHDGHEFLEGEMIHEGEIHLDPGFGFEHGHTGCGPCMGNAGWQVDEWAEPTRCPECGLYGYHAPGCLQLARCLYGCLGYLFRETAIFAGTQGYKGPIDFGLNGNFGFNEGFTVGGGLIPFPKMGLGYQIGGRWTQSDLSGNAFNSSAREQAFVTAALFHRAYRGRGLQWGVAYDWVTDNYYTTSSLGQIRTESSFLTGRGHEFGFWGAYGVKNDAVTLNMFNVNVNNQPLVPSDMYNFFYRHTTRYGGQGRVWGGVTGQSLLIAGADYRVPLSNRVDLVGGFNYVAADRGQAAGGATDESWGLNMNIMWYFGRPRQGVHNTPFRPLFQVADNNVFMLERQ